MEKEDVSTYFLDAAAALADFEEEEGSEVDLDEDIQVKILPEANDGGQYESSVDADETNDEESEEELLDV